MPGFDKTGPLGQGSRTGGGFGRCTGAQDSTGQSVRTGRVRRGVGRGGKPFGGGRGHCYGGGRRGFRGRGFGRPFFDDDERNAEQLAEQIDQLMNDNEELRARIAELESEKEKHTD